MGDQSLLKHVESLVQLAQPTVSIGQGHESETGRVLLGKEDLLEPIDLLIQRFGHSVQTSVIGKYVAQLKKEWTEARY